MNTPTSSSTPAYDLSDAMFTGWLDRIQQRFVSHNREPLFTTGIDVSKIYLNHLPPELRQHHNCHACRNFLNRYGSLVVVQPGGYLRPAMWDLQDTPELYAPSIAAIDQTLRMASVTGVFLTREQHWGTRVTGKWIHLSVEPPSHRIHGSCVLTPFQGMAEKAEDHKNVMRALHEFPIPTLQQALHLIQSEALYRSEKIAGPLKWLLSLADAVSGAKGIQKSNLVWQAVATAPAGFCHPRASMVGSLLEDLLTGMDFAAASERFAHKMRPDRYQRPVAAPKAGNIEKAERLFETLGLAPALRRRFARPDEVAVLLWKQSDPEPAQEKEGIFACLKAPKPTADDGREAPQTKITWVKFAKNILPIAREISIKTPRANGPYAALVTAVDPAAPPILQWDSPERRYPVSIYTYTFGSPSHQWNVQSDTWVPVWGITSSPAEWFGEHDHHGKAVLFLIPGAKDSGRSGLALFPECVRSELHEVRSVIEAFSRANLLEENNDPAAAGLLLGNSNKTSQGYLVRVKTAINGVRGATGTAQYHIDRWD